MMHRTQLVMRRTPGDPHPDAKRFGVDSGPRHSHVMEDAVWHQLGEPDDITVTIEPGNTIKEPT